MQESTKNIAEKLAGGVILQQGTKHNVSGIIDDRLSINRQVTHLFKIFPRHMKL